MREQRRRRKRKRGRGERADNLAWWWSGRGWRRRKSARGEGPAVAVANLPLVWIWVRREAALPSVGGGERCLRGLQGPKTRWREKEEGTSCRGEKDVHGGLLQTQWWLVGGLGKAWWCWLLKAELEEEMVTVLVSCDEGRNKKKQKKKICSGEREEGWFFGFLWTQFSSLSGHQIHRYL